MKYNFSYIIACFLFCMSCTSKDEFIASNKCSELLDSQTTRGALLGTRFQSLDELKQVIQIEYINNNAPGDSTIHKNSKVIITHCSNGKKVVAELEAGITQNEISKAQNDIYIKQLVFVANHPFCVSVRKDLEKVFLLARIRSEIFGEGDVAFFNLAEATVKNINTPDLAFLTPKDSTEKGYLNTFNHTTAQAFLTSCFSEELADFVADAHERANHKELILGKFSDNKLNDLAEGPVDNYVDIVNNEWGQELGKLLKEKYHISRKTIWTPELLANYLNDMQAYYSWAFQIGFKPFYEEDEKILKFSNKLNLVMGGISKI